MNASLMPRPNTASDQSSNEVRGSSGTGCARLSTKPVRQSAISGAGSPARFAWNGNGSVTPRIRMRACRSICSS